MREDNPRTELDEAAEPDWLPRGRFDFARDARLFSRPASEWRRLEAQKRVVSLAPGQIARPPVPCDAVVRLGQLRVSEFLSDGREVTRAVLQAGSCFRTREPSDEPEREGSASREGAGRDDESGRGGGRGHSLADIVVMAFDEAEIWLLPAGSLDDLITTA